MLYVRSDGDAAPKPVSPADLAAAGLRADTPIAADPAGPFAPVAIALPADGRLRDRLSEALRAPSLGPWARVRPVALGLGLAAAALVLELDRELLALGQATIGRLAIDAILAAYVGWELSRKTPRMPGVAAAALVALALRFGLGVSRACGHGTPMAWAAIATAAIAAGLVLSRAPSRDRVALELEDRLGIAPADAAMVRRMPEASSPLVYASVAASLALPAALVLLRKNGLGLGAQAVFFLAYAVGVPLAVRRFLDPTKDAKKAPLLAIGIGLALVAALVTGSQHFFDAGAEIARCTKKLDAESSRLLAREAAEAAQAVQRVRGSIGLLAFTALAVPLAEERVYRDLLLRVLVRRYGRSYGLFASAMVFGFAHVGIYEVALYQTVLLGLAFGVAWLEGGLLAAFAVHAAWNVLAVM